MHSYRTNVCCYIIKWWQERTGMIAIKGPHASLPGLTAPCKRPKFLRTFNTSFPVTVCALLLTLLARPTSSAQDITLTGGSGRFYSASWYNWYPPTSNTATATSMIPRLIRLRVRRPARATLPRDSGAARLSKPRTRSQKQTTPLQLPSHRTMILLRYLAEMSIPTPTLCFRMTLQ